MRASKMEDALRDPEALLAFLRAQSLDSVCSQWLPGLLDKLRVNTDVGIDAIPRYLDAMLLAYASEQGSMEDVDAHAPALTTAETFFQQFTPKTSTRRLCGYMFQRNDIAFNCKTCQMDETCVLCVPCYQNGNHEGHDIYFHRTLPGGVCDCGDPEAWAPEGFCDSHGAQEEAPTQLELPDAVVRVADVMLQQIVNFLVEMSKSCLDSFDAEQVDARGRQLLAKYAYQISGDGGNAVTPSKPPPGFHVRICNDDVHSDEDLVKSLTQKGISNAKQLVREIDSNGSELVVRDVYLRDALTLLQALQVEGWHACVVYDQLIRDEEILLRIIPWVKTLATLSRPLYTLFCDKLFSTDNELSRPKEPMHLLFLTGPYFRKQVAVELYQLYLKLQGDKDPKLKFALVFLKVYDRMMTKYFCGIGTQSESLFQYGVQIFTTPSIMTSLSELGVLDILLDTLNVALDLAKGNTPSAIAAGVPRSYANSSPRVDLPMALDCEHSLLKFRRYAFIMDNIQYVLNIPSMRSHILLKKPYLSKFFDSLRQMQGLDPQVRIQDGHAHVTYETQQWITAFQFHSMMSKLSVVLTKGVRNHEGGALEKIQMVRNVLECFWDQLEQSGITTTVLQLYQPPFGFLMGSSSRQEMIVKFDVGTHPISFHYPLHNFLANFLMDCLYNSPPSDAAAASSPWITDWSVLLENSMKTKWSDDVESENRTPEEKMLLIYGMMEFPLRTLVVSAHVQCGLWIRNGQSMQRQVLNYSMAPWCSELRDLDVFLVQISASMLGFSKFFTIFFDRFGLSEWLMTWRNSISGGRNSSRDTITEDDDKMVGVLEAALLELTWIVTELPAPLEIMKAHDTVLRREMVHRLTQHPCRLSELLDQTTFVISKPFGVRPDVKQLPRVRAILDEIADLQVQKSSPLLQADEGDDMQDGNGGSEPNKYVLKKEYFKEYDPSFYHLSRSGHERAQFARQEALFKSWKVEDTPIPFVSFLPPAHVSLASIRLMVLEKGLLGLLRMILEDATSPETADQPKRTNVMVNQRTIHVITILVLVLKTRNHQPQHPNSKIEDDSALLPENRKKQVLTLLRSGQDAFEESDAWRGKKRVKRQQSSDGDSDLHISSDSDQGEVNDVRDLSIIALLVTFVKDLVKNEFETAKSTVSGIYWILNELAAMDPVIYSFVQRKVWSGMKKHEERIQENGLTKAQLQKLHQQRAIEAMLARQKAFAQSSMFAEMDEEDDEDEQMSTAGSVGGSVVDHGEIMHENGHASTIVYRPPPPPDCIICAQKKKNDPIMFIGHTQISQVNAHAQDDKSGDETATSKESKVFPPTMYLSLCGHAVHLHCWRNYFEAVRAQSQYNLEHSQTNIAFDAQFGEFLCPLCQALSSTLVPYVPLSQTLTLGDQQREREAMERVFQSKQDTASILSWITEGLPSKLECMDVIIQDSDEDHDIEDKQNEDFETEEDPESSDDGMSRQREDSEDVSAMKQFALSFLETMIRFQPEGTRFAAAMAALKKSFFWTGPQLAHLIWSTVAATCTSAQLSAISSAMYSVESMPSSAAGRSNASRKHSGASFSSLRISSNMSGPVPCLKTRLGVSLPEALNNQVDPFSAKDDSKLNCLLRSLRHMHLLFKNQKMDFYQAICTPIIWNLRLGLSLDEWMQSLTQGPPLQLGQPILGQDLFYLSVAICSSMLHTKADILLTIRSFCVLHMAQVLLQLAQVPAESEEDSTDERNSDVLASPMEEDSEVEETVKDSTSPSQLTPEDLSMQNALETLMDRLCYQAGLDRITKQDASDVSFACPRGSQLMYMFKSSCLAFMREVTLLCRAFFRGENDPDAAWCANFVSSMRLSTNFHEMCQQLGLPTIDQILADDAMMQYLDQAAFQLQHTRFASVPSDVVTLYTQQGRMDALLKSLHEIHNEDGIEAANASPEEQGKILSHNLSMMPPLPLRRNGSASVPRWHYANIRLVRLAGLYTDLHSEVLGKSKCKKTWNVVENPAICLICEQVLCAGTECCRRPEDSMGACTYHAMTCGNGVGMFFLIRSSSVLLVYGPRSSYFGSPYLDMFGEEDINLRRGRPLYLNSKRMKVLQMLYATHQLANEVSRNRRTSDQYIRNSYY